MRRQQDGGRKTMHSGLARGRSEDLPHGPKSGHHNPKSTRREIRARNSRAKWAPLTVTRGKIHDYLGMTLAYSEEGVVQIDMRDYVKNVMNEMSDNMGGTATSPAGSYLFQLKEGIKQLDEAKSDFFHATVAKLLFFL
jgi:hypothetical protein